MQWSSCSNSQNSFKFTTLKLLAGVSSGAVKICNWKTPKHLQLRLNLRNLQISFFNKLHGSNFNTTRELCDLIRSRWVNISWGFSSWIVYMYCICLCLVAEAHVDQISSVYYACENVESYYAGVQHLRGDKLKKKLNTIISEHQSLPYTKVWDAIKILDAADVDLPEASSDVVEIYSLQIVPKSLAGKPDGWNREHLWPRSYGLITHQSLTDVHNIRAADANVNSSRGNKYYGECSPDTSHCLKPATKEAAPDTETDKKRWAPPLQVRGDIARALMYMAVCYGFPQSDGGVILRLSDFPRTANNEMGLLTTLLRWNDLDPPSREEKLRNERLVTLLGLLRNARVDETSSVKAQKGGLSWGDWNGME
ncbi:Extracellular ribonuclease [Heracleum sosnowskyi]|uniref:Extracellular ribonuclease n=1 Tax=Heracleum sosnowskyi TaxID=360622 RepID=A0AAD8IUV1_9APIA|nr:Extracellular ribonuclease [Heracleum sosnowskyi]